MEVAKRGQVTVFIIVGILILLVVGAVFILKPLLITGEIKAAKAQQENLLGATVQNYIQSCLEKTGKEALIFIGQQGGYYKLPSLHNTVLLQPYYFYEDESHLLSKEELENQLSLYIDNELSFCIRNFVVFEEQGYDIQQEEVGTTTELGKEKVIFNVKFPVVVQKGEISKTIATFTTEVSSRLGTIYGLTEKFISKQAEDPNSICLSCITELSIENDVRIEMVPIDDLMAFRIVDEKNLINGQPYEFKFLNKYIFEEKGLEELEIEEFSLEELE